jgi:hypothetical protein
MIKKNTHTKTAGIPKKLRAFLTLLYLPGSVFQLFLILTIFVPMGIKTIGMIKIMNAQHAELLITTTIITFVLSTIQSGWYWYVGYLLGMTREKKTSEDLHQFLVISSIQCALLLLSFTISFFVYFGKSPEELRMTIGSSLWMNPSYFLTNAIISLGLFIRSRYLLTKFLRRRENEPSRSFFVDYLAFLFFELGMFYLYPRIQKHLST